jgi:hypothetical protein
VVGLARSDLEDQGARNLSAAGEGVFFCPVTAMWALPPKTAPHRPFSPGGNGLGEGLRR